eukprot:COSAG04_NODE_2180_length_4609_cov_5.154989_9_plen_262_part_00
MFVAVRAIERPRHGGRGRVEQRPLQQLPASAAGPGPLAPSRSMPLLRTTLAFAASALLGGAGAAAGSGGGAAAAAAGAAAEAAKPNLIFILAVRAHRSCSPARARANRPRAPAGRPGTQRCRLGQQAHDHAPPGFARPHGGRADAVVRLQVLRPDARHADDRALPLPLRLLSAPHPAPATLTGPSPPPISPTPHSTRSRPCLPDNNQDANDYGVPLNYTMLPAALKEGGNYRTHAIGKWHAPRHPPPCLTWSLFFRGDSAV